ncbi:MAG: cyclic nucleotide-binding domain-containing protein [Anaerolineae bacterium]|nr:cyclic nucleotide-binding domain-containing protein [Anaerolineae bacterium]
MVNGRLEARVPDQHGKEQTVNVLTMGDSVGEMQVYTEQPRSANVYAVRESDLVRFSRETFSDLQAKYPQLTLHVTRQIIERMQRLITRKVSRTTLLNIALVPLCEDGFTKEFSSNLADAMAQYTKVLHLSSRKVDEILSSPGVSQHAPGEVNEIRLLTWLDEREEAYPYLIYETDADLTPWTIRSILRADRIIFVGEGHALPEERRIEKVLSFLEGEKVETGRELALYYAREASGIGVASRWIPLLEPVSRHYHVQTQADFRRMARLLTGNETGLVLGGGGRGGLLTLVYCKLFER